MARWKLRCPECAQIFVTADLDGPCKHCGWRPEKKNAEVIDIPMPFLKTSGKTAQIDKLYRDIEKGSETRMEIAAEQLGVPTSEVAGLKVTNMLDNRKPGEISMPAPIAEKSRLEAAGSRATFMPNGAEFAAGVKAGPHPNAGAKTLAGLQKITGRG